MLIYEVKLEFIDTTIYSSFLFWLKEHTSEMLTFQGFEKAQIKDTFKEDTSIIVRYHILSQESLDSYIKNHSEKMRNEGLKLFGNSFKASRKVYPLSEITE